MQIIIFRCVPSLHHQLKLDTSSRDPVTIDQISSIGYFECRFLIGILICSWEYQIHIHE